MLCRFICHFLTLIFFRLMFSAHYTSAFIDFDSDKMIRFCVLWALEPFSNIAGKMAGNDVSRVDI